MAIVRLSPRAEHLPSGSCEGEGQRASGEVVIGRTVMHTPTTKALTPPEPDRDRAKDRKLTSQRPNRCRRP